jgi:2-amino-4-hydroxy-6-hydroxymethyldihydropteridine diphosphokinase
MTQCLIAFGANQGDRSATLGHAVELLATNGFQDIRVSRSIETKPVGGPESQSFYLNAALSATTHLDCRKVAATLLAIEESCGRSRSERWAPRTIDLDLLLFGNMVVDEPQLCIPHPRMTFRRFVLDPACEVAGDMLHPLCGLTLSQLRSRITSAKRFFCMWLTSNPDFVSAVADRVNAGRLESRIDVFEVDSPTVFPVLEPPHWRMRVVSEPVQFGVASETPKLMIGDRNHAVVNAQKLVATVLRFPGASLVVAEDERIAAQDLAAALTALEAFD